MMNSLTILQLDDLGLIGPFIIAFIFAFAIVLLPTIFFILTLQSTLEKVSPENRKMKPGEVWLLLIPIFGLIWRFIVVNRMADSLQAEFKKRQIYVKEQRPGGEVGDSLLHT